MISKMVVLENTLGLVGGRGGTINKTIIINKCSKVSPPFLLKVDPDTGYFIIS